MKISWYWLPLLIVSLVTILSSSPVAAQLEETGLALRLVFDNLYDGIAPGKDKTVYLEVENTGNRVLTNIRLSADKPEGWTVEFNPALIDSLSPKNLNTVDIIIRPASNATDGNYNITILAQANETRRVTSIFLRVDSESFFWVWLGAGIAALVIVAAIIIFIRFGRQQMSK